jgi:hypothetical protein
MTALAPTLEAFFTQRLLAQRRASPNTIAAYRDTCRLLLGFVHEGQAYPRPRCSWSTSTPQRSERPSTTSSGPAASP